MTLLSALPPAGPRFHVSLHPDQLEAGATSRDLVLDPQPTGHPAGAFTSVRALTEAIQRFIDHWNDNCRPFVWVKTADEILAMLHRQRSHETVH